MKTSIFKHSMILSLIAVTICLTACKPQEKSPAATNNQQRTITAAIQSHTSHLFYSGVIQPLHMYNVSSPVDGVIDAVFFRLGESVTAGQALLKISSSKSQQDYAAALTTFIKDKDQYFQNKAKFEGTTALYKAGIVGREEYLSQQSQLGSSRLSYINSTNALRNIAKKIPGAPQNLEALTLKDVTAIEAMLSKQQGEFSINSPISGLALAPEVSTPGESNTNKTLSAGTEVKQNQALVSIGDMTGLSVNIHVNEMDINKIRVGQEAVLSSPALPGMVFKGKVNAIVRQAKSADSGGGGMANFPVTVVVEHITDEQRELVKVGMNIKVELIIASPAGIKIPLKAVFFNQGKSQVTIIDAKGQRRDVPVETGATELENIIILKGLNPGDKVLIRD